MNPKKIFIANSGRCGSLFFSLMFTKSTGIKSYHEPHPWCVGKTSEEVNNNNISATTKKVLDLKIAQIDRDADKYGNYLDSSQMFIKSYMERVLQEYQDIYVIYLYRNIYEVGISFSHKLVGMPWDWLLNPIWENNYLRTIVPMNYYEVVMWNWFEVRERFYRNRHRFIKTYEFDFEKINDPTEWSKLFLAFGINVVVDKMPKLYKNPMIAQESDSYETYVSRMKKNWLEPGKRWRFPDDLTQIAMEEHSKMLEKLDTGKQK